MLQLNFVINAVAPLSVIRQGIRVIIRSGMEPNTLGTTIKRLLSRGR